MQKEVYIGEGTLLIIFAVTKLLIRSNVKKRDYFGTVFESIVYHGKKITMAGHIVLSVRNQRAMNTCTQFTFSFYSVWVATHVMVLPTFKMSLPQLNFSGNS